MKKEKKKLPRYISHNIVLKILCTDKSTRIYCVGLMYIRAHRNIYLHVAYYIYVPVYIRAASREYYIQNPVWDMLSCLHNQYCIGHIRGSSCSLWQILQSFFFFFSCHFPYFFTPTMRSFTSILYLPFHSLRIPVHIIQFVFAPMSDALQ